MKLNLGCGKDIKPGFINIDINPPNNPSCLALDLRTAKLPEGSEYVYACHFVEHLEDIEALSLFKRVYSCLVPKGTFRILVPNYPEIFQHYLDKDSDYFSDCPIPGFGVADRTIIDWVQYATHQMGEHKSLWDITKFRVFLNEAGFINPTYETHYKSEIDPNCPLRRHFSLCVEVKK